jgi:hypothetical protein
VGRLNRLREAGEWGRRLSRGVVLLKRLERQMGVVRGQETKGQKGQKEGEEGEREERERELVRAGLTLAELGRWFVTPPQGPIGITLERSFLIRFLPSSFTYMTYYRHPSDASSLY